jgi:glutathione synthase/RimK-type ligase-like ATP-grasp enzyme
MNLGKWEKHTCLLQNQELTSHLPETRLFSKKHFKRMIKKHQQVILKPDHGTCGMGIMLVCEYKKRNMSFTFEMSQNVSPTEKRY